MEKGTEVCETTKTNVYYATSKKHPEMPEETELNNERRKQLAELMLEYPTRIDAEEQEDPLENKQGK